MSIFSKIIAGEIPSTKLYEDDEIIVIKDINPRAKTHLLIIPKKPIETIKDLNENEQDHQLVGRMVLVARNVAKELNLPGYKLLFNVGKEGGQEVFHIHLHLMSDH